MQQIKQREQVCHLSHGRRKSPIGTHFHGCLCNMNPNPDPWCSGEEVTAIYPLKDSLPVTLGAARLPSYLHITRSGNQDSEVPCGTGTSSSSLSSDTIVERYFINPRGEIIFLPTPSCSP